MSNYSDSQYVEAEPNTSWYKVFALVPEGAKVLDVGCSSGNFGNELIRRKDCTVDGLELNKADAKTAAKKLRHVYVKNVETDSLTELDTDYDIIYFGDVIEHLVDPAAALARIKKYLAPKGKLLFSIPNMGHVSVRLYLLKGEFDYGETGLLDKTHLHFYTLEEVRRVFAEAQLEIDQLDFVHKDYPKALIKRELAAAGLQADEKFFEHMQHPGAAAFQFVGTAKKAGKKLTPKKRIDFTPIDMFETYHTDVIQGYELRLEELKKAAALLHAARTVLHHARRPARFARRKLGRK